MWVMVSCSTNEVILTCISGVLRIQLPTRKNKQSLSEPVSLKTGQAIPYWITERDKDLHHSLQD